MRWEVREKTDGRKSWDLRGFWGGNIFFFFFFIRRESRGGQTTAKKKRRNRERGGSREKEVTEGEEEVENLDTEVSLEGKFFFRCAY